MHLLFFVSTILFVAINVALASDYYEALGLNKDTTDREIRRAFKKLALVFHPDKNQDDPEAQEKFLKIKKAYEVLKDSDLRRKYDLYGEKGLDEGRTNSQYHSWSFYQNSFGLYDDSEEIITLTSADFYQSVTSSHDYWFVNFYSPGCSHCHTIAPIWKELAAGLDGVIRIGAVNCQEEWEVCSNNGIHSYPSLVFYPTGENYHGSRTLEDLDNFVLSRLPKSLITVENLNDFDSEGESHLFFFCHDIGDEDCPSQNTREKIAIILDRLANVGVVYYSNTPDICRTVGISSGSAYFSSNEFTTATAKEITSLSFNEIVSEVYNLLPDVPALSLEGFEAARRRLQANEEAEWFITFRESDDSSREDGVDSKRLQGLLGEMNHGSVYCNELADFCKVYNVRKFPSYGILKMGGAFELVWGKEKLQDIVAFAKDAVATPNFVTLNEELFNKAVLENRSWIIDFYAPWCPPCRRILPVIREASRLLSESVSFGTLDCVKHPQTCSRLGIRSYPSLVLFNNNVQFSYQGDHKAERIVEFVEDTLNPPAIQLTFEKFNLFVARKAETEIWVVDFYASWCGPCQQLKPHWSKLAKSLAPLSPLVRVAEVDCVKEVALCQAEGVNSYPTIRLYPLGYVGKTTFIPFTSNQREHNSIRHWVMRIIPTAVLSLSDRSFHHAVLQSEMPWIVGFYLPWCGPCQIFGPHFEIAAKALEGKFKFAKISCDQYAHICQQANIRSYPAVRLYSGITDSFDHQSFVGKFLEARDAKSLIEQVTELLAMEVPVIMHDEL